MSDLPTTIKWCTTHNASSDTGKPHCLYVRATGRNRVVRAKNRKTACVIVAAALGVSDG